MEYDLQIINGMILPEPGSPTLIDDGFLMIKGRQIAQLGSMAELPEVEAKNIIDASGCLLMPGLVNSHCHAAMTLFRGLADDLPLMTWLHEHIFPAEARCVSREMVYWCSRLAAAEMILSGTTTVADSYFYEDRAAQAFADSGMRAIAAQGIIDFPAPGVQDPSKNIEAALFFAEKWQGHERITPAFFCHSPYTCSPETLQGSKEAARQRGYQFFIHAAETKSETEQITKEYGLSPIRHLHKLGVLDSDTVLVHCVHLDQEEIGLVKRSNCGVVTCPESNMKLASGVAPVGTMKDCDINLGVGTDGCASNNDLDLFLEMDSLAKLQKIANMAPTAVPANAALQMATSGGAKTLGLGDTIGSLQVGRQADMIIVDLNQPHLVPFYNPDLIVYAAKGSDVRDSIINGKLVMRNRNVLSFDIQETISKVKELSVALLRKS